jgi:hypothetical protein
MSNRYPCPNPICTYEFDPAQLAGAASVTCPKCGIVIQLRAQPAATTVTTPAAVPLARPVASPAPAADPFAAPPAADATPIVRARKGQKGHDWLMYVALIGGFLVVLGIGAGAVINQLRGPGGGPGGPAMSLTNTDLNVRLPAPGGKWDQNPALRNAIDGSLLAFQRSDPPAWFVLAARDYKDHDPSPRELDDEARARLASYFKNVDTEPAKDAPLRAADPVAGQPANVIVFQGEIDDERVAGECHFFRSQGVGYWVYTWKRGAVDQRDDPDFVKMRQSAALIGERAKWKEVLSSRKTFTGKKKYKLTDPTGRWTQVTDDDEVTTHDPAADLVLFATDPKNKLKPEVFLVVMTLPKGGDPVEAAKKHVLEMQKRGSYDMATIADEGGVKDTVGTAKGWLLRWRVQLTPSLARFAVAGVVPRDGDLLLLYAECETPKRNAWEAQMQAIMDTLQLE